MCNDLRPWYYRAWLSSRRAVRCYSSITTRTLGRYVIANSQWTQAWTGTVWQPDNCAAFMDIGLLLGIWTEWTGYTTFWTADRDACQCWEAWSAHRTRIYPAVVELALLVMILTIALDDRGAEQILSSANGIARLGWGSLFTYWCKKEADMFTAHLLPSYTISCAPCVVNKGHLTRSAYCSLSLRISGSTRPFSEHLWNLT
jgi:hypothetical protein